MNNPMMMLFQLMQNGGNPMSVLQNMQSPQARQAGNMIQGKNRDQLRQTAENLAKQRGIDLAQFASKFGMRLP